MTTLRLIGAAVFILVSVAIALGNLVSAISARRRRALVPFISIFTAAVAYLVYPNAPELWILALPTLDIANWAIILRLPIAARRRDRSVSDAPPGEQEE